MTDQNKMIDLTFLEKFSKGNSEKIISFVKLYNRTAPKLFEELLNYAIQKKWEDVSIKAHSLKSQVKYMGIDGLDTLLAEIEFKAKEDQDRSELTELVFSAVKKNDIAMAELEDYLVSNLSSKTV
jgi:hypothetical protein